MERETKLKGAKRPESADFLGGSPIPAGGDSGSLDWISRKSPLRFMESFIDADEDSEVLSGLYSQRVETCLQMLGQLDVSIRRHEGLLSYVKSLQIHLSQNSAIACADLANRYNVAKTALSALFDDCTSQIERNVREKEKLLCDKVVELTNFVERLNGVKGDLEFRLKAESKAMFVQNFREHVAETKEALEQWAADVDISSELLAVKAPHFLLKATFDIASGISVDAAVQTSDEVEVRGNSLDSVQIALLSDFQELEQRRKAVLERSLPLLALSDEKEQKSTQTVSSSRHSRHTSKRRVYHSERSSEAAKLPIDVISTLGASGHIPERRNNPQSSQEVQGTGVAVRVGEARNEGKAARYDGRTQRDEPKNGGKGGVTLT